MDMPTSASSFTLNPNTRVEENSTTYVDRQASLFDPVMSAANGGAGDFTGASVTLVRDSGATAEDIFGVIFFASNPVQVVADMIEIDGQAIARVARAEGQITVTFTDAAGVVPTSARVNEVLRALSYSNTSDTPPPNVDIRWTFDDGNSGTASTVQPLGISAINDRAIINDDLSARPVSEGYIDAEISLGTFTAFDPEGDAFNMLTSGTAITVRETVTVGEYELFVQPGLYIDYEQSSTVSVTVRSVPVGYDENAMCDFVCSIGREEYPSVSTRTFVIPVTDVAAEVIDASDWPLGLKIFADVDVPLADPSDTSRGLRLFADGPQDMQLTGGANGDTIRSDSGNDVLDGSGGNDSLTGGSGEDFIIGGDGNDRIFGEDEQDRLQGHAGDDYLLGGAGNDTVNGGTGDDTVIGGSGDDLLFGLAGRDELTGGNGNDTLFGGEGDDRFFAQAGDDVVHGGTGSNTVHLGAGNDQFFGALTGNDTVYSIVGHDTLFGGGGDDVLWGQLGHDVIDGGDGNDQIQGGVGHDNLGGGAGNDVFDAGPGWDTIDGGLGSDTLIGGRGNDLLTGGAGADTFVFNARGGWDTLTDFERGIDTIEITYDAANFAQLGVSQNGSDTVIWYGSGGIILDDFNISQISIEDFIFS